MKSLIILCSFKSNSDFDRNEANGKIHKAWYIMAFYTIALNCLARFSAPPAAAGLPITVVVVYSILRILP